MWGKHYRYHIYIYAILQIPHTNLKRFGDYAPGPWLSNYIAGNVHIAYSSGVSNCGVLPTVTDCASCHSLSPEIAIHLAGTGVQVLIYMGQMQTQKRQSYRFPRAVEYWVTIQIKAILLEKTTKKWYIYVRKYMIQRLTAWFWSFLLRVESCN